MVRAVFILNEPDIFSDGFYLLQFFGTLALILVYIPSTPSSLENDCMTNMLDALELKSITCTILVMENWLMAV